MSAFSVRLIASRRAEGVVAVGPEDTGDVPSIFVSTSVRNLANSLVAASPRCVAFARFASSLTSIDWSVAPAFPMFKVLITSVLLLSRHDFKEFKRFVRLGRLPTAVLPAIVLRALLRTSPIRLLRLRGLGDFEAIERELLFGQLIAQPALVRLEPLAHDG